MSTALRVAAAQHALARHDIDALLVTHPANIRYLTGLSASAGAVLVAPELTLLLVDFRYATAARAVCTGRVDLAVLVADGKFDEAVADSLRRLKGHRIGVEAAHLPVSRYNWLARRLAADGDPGRTGVSALVPTEGVIEHLRIVKDADEIATLREAARRLSLAARQVLAGDVVRPGRTEQDVAAAIDAIVRANGFERTAFETIVASGPNSALPHARPTTRRLASGEGVVLDFGGVYDGYCVDLTRTVHIGPLTAGFRRLFDAVRAAQAAAIAAVRPGATPVEIDAAARGVLQERGLGEAFGHGTGHGLGLEVHEGPRISHLATEEEPVAAGMVFTIEPGAYVPDIGGVRIEDDVLVEEGGCEVLTTVPVDFEATQHTWNSTI